MPKKPGTLWTQKLGAAGEAAVISQLSKLGWDVEDLNAVGNAPNADLLACRRNKSVFIQVKTYNDYRWISGGGVNPAICGGAPLFNKVEGTHKADFVICLTPAEPGDKKVITSNWRYFVMPIDIAERNFRINIDKRLITPIKGYDEMELRLTENNAMNSASVQSTIVNVSSM